MNVDPPPPPFQACRLLLTLPVPQDLYSDQSKDSKKGYDELISSLISLMSVGVDYANQNKELAERVLLASSAHQCFSLTMSMLGTLPPSYQVLLAVVEGKGLTLMVSGRN